MTVVMVTTRKGGTPEAMIAATKKLKAAAEKNGAERVLLSQVVIGPDVGHWVIRIVCPDMASFGKVVDAATSDPAALEALAAMNAISEITSRRMLTGFDL